jgi:hypothetical protein
MIGLRRGSQKTPVYGLIWNFQGTASAKSAVYEGLTNAPVLH